MKIFVATDHAGLELKNTIRDYLLGKGYDVTDCGAYSYDKNDDYPDFIAKAALEVSKDPKNCRGVILGGSGQAEAIVANKFKGVRCALFYKEAIPITAADITGRESNDPLEMIRLSREHNDSNMISIGARFVSGEQAVKVVTLWLSSPFTADERHVRRLSKLAIIENNR